MAGLLFNFRKLLAPFTHLADSDSNKFSLQASAYRLIEERNTPLVLGDCDLVYLTEYEGKPYKARDLRAEILGWLTGKRMHAHKPPLIVRGTQIIIDLYDCQTPTSPTHTRFLGLLEKAGFNVTNDFVHDFGHGEVTCLAILSQSHAALHTWYEHNYVSVDVYSCGLHEEIVAKANVLIALLQNFYKPRGYDVRLFERGVGLSGQLPVSVD